MGTKMERLVEAMRDAVLCGPASTKATLREAIAARAAAPADAGPEVPETMRTYLDKVAHAPWKVIDEDLEGLRDAGYSDDSIYELTVAAAVGAGLARFECGMAALKGKKP